MSQTIVPNLNAETVKAREWPEGLPGGAPSPLVQWQRSESLIQGRGGKMQRTAKASVQLLGEGEFNGEKTPAFSKQFKVFSVP